MTRINYTYNLAHDDELDMQDRIANKFKFVGRAFSDCQINAKEYT